MRSFWILPDKEQTGVMSVFDGRNSIPLHKVINLKELPSALVLGIPEQVLLANPGMELVFAQYARLQSGKSIFTLSMRAGVDKTNRTIVITNLQMIESDEQPSLSSRNIDEGVIFEGKEEIVRFQNGLLNESNLFLTRVMNMLEAVIEYPALQTFSSEPLPISANKPDWSPSKKKHDKSIVVLIVLTVLLIVVSVFRMF